MKESLYDARKKERKKKKKKKKKNQHMPSQKQDALPFFRLCLKRTPKQGKKMQNSFRL
jgi:hypothetical protein